MSEKLKLGQLDDETAKICLGLKCPLLNRRPYDICQVKAKLDQQRYHSIYATSQTARDFHEQIPENCPKGYYIYRAVVKGGRW